jgi:hypothetical protein
VAPGICTDVDEAVACAAAGADVVLVLVEGAPFDAGRAAPGRVAIFVVGGGEEPDLAAAAAMEAELFGPPNP